MTVDSGGVGRLGQRPGELDLVPEVDGMADVVLCPAIYSGRGLPGPGMQQ